MNQRLHILFLSSWYPSRVLPNNGDFVQRHAEAVATKHQVTLVHVISDKNLNTPIEITENNINDVRTLIAYIKTSNNPIIKLYRFFSAYLNLIKHVNKFDLAHLNVIYPVGLIALYLKWFKNRPFIVSEHWTDYQFPLNKSISFLKKIATKIIVKNAAFICPVTENLQKDMIQFGLNGSYYPVPNVVNTSVFDISDEKISEFTITHISNMADAYKNISGFLNVMSKLQEKISPIKINLIGNNSDKYISLIKKLNIKNIEVIDQISHNQVAEYLKKSNLFVLFSNYENLPCVILEAFSCGVPVVATNVGGISEYFPEKFGELIKPKNELALEKAILKIYNANTSPNKQEMHQYAENNFSLNTISTVFSNLYKKTLKYKN